MSRHAAGMDRRTFLGTVGIAVLTAPIPVEAQQGAKIYRLGVLWHAESREAEGPIFEAFIAGLRERGYVESRNISFEHRFPAEMPERFKSMATELVALKPDLLVGVSPPSAVALKNTGTSIPIIFTSVADAVAAGLVSYARPRRIPSHAPCRSDQPTSSRAERRRTPSGGGAGEGRASARRQWAWSFTVAGGHRRHAAPAA